MIVSVAQHQAEMLAAEKGRRKRERERAEQARDDGAARLGTDDVAEGARAALAAESDEAAVKSLAQLDALEGSGEGMRPGGAEPEDFGRGYVEPGHAAPSPQHEAPRTNPMPALQPGVPTPIALPDAPMAVRIEPHVTAAYSLTSPSLRDGR